MQEINPFTINLFEAISGNHILLKANPPVYTVLAVTEGYVQVSQKEKKAIVGKGIFETFPSNPYDLTDTGEQNLRDSFEQVINYKKPHTLTLQRYDTQNAKGLFAERYWKLTCAPVFENSGGVACIIQTVEELTDGVMEKKLEQIARHTRQLEIEREYLSGTNVYLQQVINLFKAPLQVLAPVIENGVIVDFRYKLTNAAYAAYANTTPEKLQNKKVGDVFPGYFQTSSFTNVVKAFETGIADTWEIHYNVDGLDIYNEMSATRMGDEVVVHFTEFTKLKHLQFELIRKVEELERSNRNLEEFAHAASHDLKEPVRKVHVFTSRLKEQLSDHLSENERVTFEKIEAAARRMALLIDDLLLYSHASQLPIEKEPVDLNNKLQRVLEDLELDIQQKGAVVQIEKLPVVQGYKRQLQQVFQNLISNALKYSKANEPSCICINAQMTSENGRRYHVVEVKDNGIGFEQHHADKIFQIFSRLHGKAEYSGTGVGLSIVKKVVENHGGMVKVKSQPGRGSTFKVYLPAD